MTVDPVINAMIHASEFEQDFCEKVAEAMAYIIIVSYMHHSEFTEDCKQALKIYGHKLNSLGGLTLMQDAFYKTKQLIIDEKTYDFIRETACMRLMENAWDEIGEWQA